MHYYQEKGRVICMIDIILETSAALFGSAPGNFPQLLTVHIFMTTGT
jgi:hypothetical protein